MEATKGKLDDTPVIFPSLLFLIAREGDKREKMGTERRPSW